MLQESCLTFLERLFQSLGVDHEQIKETLTCDTLEAGAPNPIANRKWTDVKLAPSTLSAIIADESHPGLAEELIAGGKTTEQIMQYFAENPPETRRRWRSGSHELRGVRYSPLDSVEFAVVFDNSRGGTIVSREDSMNAGSTVLHWSASWRAVGDASGVTLLLAALKRWFIPNLDVSDESGLFERKNFSEDWSLEAETALIKLLCQELQWRQTFYAFTLMDRYLPLWNARRENERAHLSARELVDALSPDEAATVRGLSASALLFKSGAAASALEAHGIRTIGFLLKAEENHLFDDQRARYRNNERGLAAVDDIEGEIWRCLEFFIINVWPTLSPQEKRSLST